MLMLNEVLWGGGGWGGGGGGDGEKWIGGGKKWTGPFLPPGEETDLGKNRSVTPGYSSTGHTCDFFF